MDQKRIDKLNEIGFTWDAQEASWERQMDELCAFYEKYGTCDVSRSDKDHHKLYRWIREQKRIYRDKNEMGQSGGLSEKRISALKGIGFIFDSVGTTLTSQQADLTKFHREQSHCELANENHELNQWVQRVRNQYQNKLNGKESMAQPRHIQAFTKMEFSCALDESDSITYHDDEELHLASMSSTSNTSSSSFSEHSSLMHNKRNSNDKYMNTLPLKKRRVDFL